MSEELRKMAKSIETQDSKVSEDEIPMAEEVEEAKEAETPMEAIEVVNEELEKNKRERIKKRKRTRD